jgi:hypothetical protein
MTSTRALAWSLMTLNTSALSSWAVRLEQQTEGRTGSTQRSKRRDLFIVLHQLSRRATAVLLGRAESRSPHG